MKAKREKKCNLNAVAIANTLSKEVISQYFYMPIRQAAKELNVGLTLFKRRCRQLQIPRWPHRKLMSLNSLINNIQVLQTEERGEGSERKLKVAMDVLGRERKMLEMMPDMELADKTKRLRQACFKVNHKKRKLLISTMLKQSPPSMSSATTATATATATLPYDMEEEEEEEEEEMKALSSDSCSSTSTMI